MTSTEQVATTPPDPPSRPTPVSASRSEVHLTGAQVGSKLWSIANTLRAAGVRPADYQAFTLPVLMFKVVCDRNAAEETKVVAEDGTEFWEMLKDRLAPFDVPPGCSFDEQQRVAQNLGESLTTALTEIEKHNGELAGVFLGTDYATLADRTIRDIYAVLAQVSFSPEQTSQDGLGQAYEYLLGKFADAAGAKAGQFFTPPGVAQLLVEITDPRSGESAYDPTCGSGGLLNTVAEHVAASGAERTTVALHGQELDAQSYAIAKVNMLLHGNSGSIRQGDTLADPKFVDDDRLHHYDVVVANPPFGMENSAYEHWAADRYGRARWGGVTRKPAELAFVAHMASSLRGVDGDEPSTGRAAVVLPMGALFRKGAEGAMRRNLLEAGLVEAVVALPANLFYNTSIPASVLVLRVAPSHPGHVLFVDATACFSKGKKQNVLDAEHRATLLAAYRSSVDHGEIHTALVPVADVVAADSDLTVAHWLPSAVAETVDVNMALARLRQAEASTEAAAQVFWSRLAGAGYVS